MLGVVCSLATSEEDGRLVGVVVESKALAKQGAADIFRHQACCAWSRR